MKKKKIEKIALGVLAGTAAAGHVIKERGLEEKGLSRPEGLENNGMVEPDFVDNLQKSETVPHNDYENMDPDKMVAPDFIDSLAGTDKLKKTGKSDNSNLLEQIKSSEKSHKLKNPDGWKDEPDSSDAWKIGGAIAGATVAVGAAGTAAGIAIKKHRDKKNNKEAQEIQKVEEQKIEKPKQKKKVEEKDITDTKIDINIV